MYCGDASTSGNHLTRRIGSACGESRDRDPWNIYCRVPLQVFLLRRAILLLYNFVRQNFHPLTAATFGDWSSPRAQTHYREFRTITIGLDDYNCLITAMVYYNDYSIPLLGKNDHPMTVATFSDPLCHFEPKPIILTLGHT